MRHRSLRVAIATLIVAVLALPGPALAWIEPEKPPMRPFAPPAPPPGAIPGKELPPDVKVSRDEAVSIARRTFAIPPHVTESHVNIYQTKTGATWDLFFESPERQADRTTVTVGVDAMTGALRSYNLWSSAAETAPLAYTRGEAFAKAQTWMQQLAPQHLTHLRLAQSPPVAYGMYWEKYAGGRAVHQFRWERLEQGYSVMGDGVTITISARSGELEQFNLAWRDDVSFTLPAQMLTPAQASAAYRSRLPQMLQYARFYRPDGDVPQWRLVYRPLTGLYPNAAPDGTLLDPMGAPLDLAQYQPGPVVPAADTPYQAPTQALTRDAALTLAQAAAGRADEPTLSNYAEQGREQKQRTWEFQWSKEGELLPGERQTQVQVDADRGLVLRLGSWGPTEPLKEGEEPAVSEAKARAIAMAFFRTYRPDLAGSALMAPTEPWQIKEKLERARMPFHQVSFIRLVRGIPVADSRTWMEVDARTGQVTNFNGDGLDESGADFPMAVNIITAEAAMDAFIDQSGMEPAWVIYWMPGTPDQKAESEPVARLVWTLTRVPGLSGIDARSGALLDYRGMDLIRDYQPPADIVGHFAQREIELLWTRGVLQPEGGRFLPGKAATMGEVVRWLVATRGLPIYQEYDFARAFAGRGVVIAKVAASPDARFFGAVFQSGILRPADFPGLVDPDALVSRELFALWAVRAMGYGPIAAMGHRVQMKFGDEARIGAGYRNAVAILQGLGVVQGDGRDFWPQRSITRGEAAKILFAVAAPAGR